MPRFEVHQTVTESQIFTIRHWVEADDPCHAVKLAEALDRYDGEVIEKSDEEETSHVVWWGGEA